MDASGTIETQEPKKTAPAYVSFATFTTCMADLKEHGIPNKIDRSVLTRFSGITGTQLMTAMRFLGLMDQSSKPTNQLAALVKAHGTPEWPKALRPVLEAAYAPIFAINLETATPNEFTAAFARAFPAATAESVIKRCIAFFLPAAQDAGIQISRRILTGRKPRAAGTGPRRKAPKAPAGAAGAPANDHPPPPAVNHDASVVTPPTAFQLTAMLEPSMTPEEQTAVWTLIRYARKKEATSTKK